MVGMGLGGWEYRSAEVDDDRVRKRRRTKIELDQKLELHEADNKEDRKVDNDRYGQRTRMREERQ